MSHWTAQDWALFLTALAGFITTVITAVKANNKADVNSAQIENLRSTTESHANDIRSLNEQATATALSTPAVAQPTTPATGGATQ
jgi:hypothetical protein